MSASELPTREDLREAISHASIAHKKAILRSEPLGVVSTLGYLHRLIEQYQDRFDTPPPPSGRVDNTWDASDISAERGFHAVSRIGTLAGTPRR